MPIEEKLAEFLESYVDVLKDMGRRFRPLFGRAATKGGVNDELRRKVREETEYFAGRMANVPVPPCAEAVNFAQGCPFIERLRYEGERFSLKMGYYNRSFSISDNCSFLVARKQPMPGSMLEEDIRLHLSRARIVEWQAVTQKRDRVETSIVYRDESGGNVMEVVGETLEGNFWSPGRREKGAMSLVGVKCGEFSPIYPIKSLGQDYMSVTSAVFSRRALGSREIDAFLARIAELPALETAYPLFR